VSTDKQLLRVEPLYLDKAEAAAFLSVSVSTFEKLLREDTTFPRPRALSANRNGYLVAELRGWGESRPVADRLPPPNTSRTLNCAHKATSPIAQGVRSVW
jgi:prophage regulatory protein